MALPSPWAAPIIENESVNLSDIIKSEKSKKEKTHKQIQDDYNLAKNLARELSKEESWKPKYEKRIEPETDEYGACCSKNIIESITLPNESSSSLEETKNDDLAIAQLLQAEYDLEYDENLKRFEQSRNKNSKISVSLSKYRLYPDDLLDNDSDKEDEDIVEERRNKNWDRFDLNQKEISQIGKSGYVDTNGKILTKHDERLSGRKNAGRIMEFDTDLPSGDCGNFDMKVSNKVFNELRAHSNSMAKKTNQAKLDRKLDVKTNEMGVDVNTRIILYKLVNTACIIDGINGVISTGKEALILHGESNLHNPDYPNLPKEVAIKIFSTTLNEFKQRDRYIKDDYRFKGSLKQNNRNIIQMWCEKEMHNLNRLKKAGIACPEVVVMKKHVLVMSYIGDGYANPALKLKNAILSKAELICAYHEVVEIMKSMYQNARLVHADFSEFNILWHDGKCFVIDLAQAVEPIHPSAMEFLMRDCDNITKFFEKRGVSVKSKEHLFFEITELDPLTTNVTMLERIHMKGEPSHVVTRPDNLDDAKKEKVPEKFRLKEFPFDYAWQKVEEMKEKSKDETLKTPNEDEKDGWVEVTQNKKKKNNRNKTPLSKGASKTIIDKVDVTNPLKEISVSIA